MDPNGRPQTAPRSLPVFDMSVLTTNLNPRVNPQRPSTRTQVLVELVDELRTWFAVDFSVWDARSCCLLYAGRGQPQCDEGLIAGLIAPLTEATEPQLLGEADNVVLLGLPLQISPEQHWVAVAAFVTRHVHIDDVGYDACRLLVSDRSVVADWINAQKPWDVESLLRLAAAVGGKIGAESQVNVLENEIEQVSKNLASTYEEISLLYGVIQNLRLTSTDEELGRLALDWLMECLPASGIAIQFQPVAEAGSTSYGARTEPRLLTAGECPIDGRELAEMIAEIARRVERWPFIANRLVSGTASWRFATVRQLILAPLCEGDKVHGWLAAFNHVDDDEFDSMEASLLTSVGAILGIHSGNHELYRQQSEFMANVVRALTSAIDAKDPYTCGHSERVARISVRLAKHLGCDSGTLETLYMAGLLHDIGKIGIDDSVLRKTGRLTDAEYEHIKLHPELGYKILFDLRQFSEVLPVVLHHHEQWNGEGYPHELSGEEIPYLARICAVADSYDAMTSDRSYRKGMPENKVDRIFREGAGTQWDPQIIDAYFAVKDEVRDIARRKPKSLMFDVQQWM